MADRVVRPGDVAVMPLPDGGYGVCQVTGADDAVIAACALRWYSGEPPALDELRGVEPLRLDHHAYDGWLAHVSVVRSYPVPPDFVWIGSMPVPPGVPALSNTFSGWQTLALDVVRQRRWDRELPAGAKAAYRTAATRGQVDVDFGAGAVTLGAATPRLDLSPGGVMPVPASGPVAWSALDLLPRCTAVSWVGPDRGFGEALAARPIVSSVRWHDAPPVVDLAGTGVANLTLAGEGLREVRLPRGLRTLELLDPSRHLAVHAADGGRWLRLVIRASTAETTVPGGLRHAREVVLDGGGVLSAAPLAVLQDLRTLEIRWRQPPGQLTNAAELAGLHELAVVELYDGYGLDAATLPMLPSLTHMNVVGVRRSVVPALKARYRGTAVHLMVHGAKPDTWLAANLNNPFRDWIDDHSRGGAAACKAYASAVRAIDRLAPSGAGRLTDAETILRRLIDTLNRIDQKYEFIDTVRREEAGDAFVGLAVRAGVEAPLADQWFDSWRDF